MRYRAVAAIIAVLTLCVSASPARAARGGPDAGTYIYIDSTETGGPAYAFEDLTASGTPFSFDYYGSASLSSPFPFRFYGNDYTTIYASAYGQLSFDYNYYYGYYVSSIPNAYVPNNFIAGYWGSGIQWYYGGTFRSETRGTAPNRRFIVQYTTSDCYYYCYPVSFEFKVFEGSNAIEVHYAATPATGGYHAAGIENADGTVGLQYHYGSAAITSPSAVRYLPVPPPTAPLLDGPSRGRARDELAFTLTANDPSGYGIAYEIDWGDGSRAERVPDHGAVPSGTPLDARHSYLHVGSYNIEARAINELGVRSPASSAIIDIVNDAPATPRAPTAPAIGFTLVDVEASTSAVDPDADDVAITIDWGDGSAPQRVPAAGHVSSGDEVRARHRYTAPGRFAVTAWAEDIYGSVSDRSVPSTIEVLL